MNDMATLTVPAGWKILSEQEKNRFLQKNFDEPPNNILAIALPDGGDGSVFAQLSFQPTGYIEDKTLLNAKTVQDNIVDEIRILNSENDAGDDEKVRWKGFSLRPKYDAKSHCAEYGIELLFGHDAGINLYQMCLLRNGALILTLVGTPKDHLQLKDWHVTPKTDLQYDKFDPKKDQRAEGNLNNLLLMNRIL